MLRTFRVRYSIMVMAIILGTLLSMACVATLGFWACYVIATWGRPKPPKRQPPPAPQKTSPPVKTPPLPKTSPLYLRRWGLYRTHSVATQKAEWDQDFDRLLHDR